MSKRKISALIAAGASIFIFISLFSNSILSRSERNRSIGIGFTEVEECRGSRCRSVSIIKYERDLGPVGSGLWWFQFVVALGGFAVLGRRFLADNTVEAQKKVDKYHLSQMIAAVIGLLIVVGWMVALKNLHGLKRMHLTAGTSFYTGTFGYLLAIASFAVMKMDHGEGLDAPQLSPPPPSPDAPPVN